jgi:nitrous oxidase accessory protein NosD
MSPVTEVRATGTDEQSVMDAAAAIQQAGGGTLIFPKGVYTFHHLLLELDNVIIRGEGDDTVLTPTYLHTDGVQALRLIGNNLMVRDLAIRAANPLMEARAGFNDYELLRIGGRRGRFTTGVVVDNVTFTKGGGCNAYRTQNVQLINSRYTGSHGNSFGCVEVKADALVEGVTATDGNDDLVAITCDADVPGGTLRAEVRNNTLARTDAKAICTSGADGVVVEDNHCEDSCAPAIQVFQDTHFGLEPSRRITIRRNTIVRGGAWFGEGRMHATHHPAPHGIQFAGEDITVEDNTVIDTAGRGIQADGTARFRINRNTVIGAGLAGINVGNPDRNEPGRNTDGEVNDNITHRTASGIVLGSGTRIEATRNKVSAFRHTGTGETRGLYYGNIVDSRIHNNMVANTDGGHHGLRDRPGSINTRTHVWANTIAAPH